MCVSFELAKMASFSDDDQADKKAYLISSTFKTAPFKNKSGSSQLTFKTTGTVNESCCRQCALLLVFSGKVTELEPWLDSVIKIDGESRRKTFGNAAACWLDKPTTTQCHDLETFGDILASTFSGKSFRLPRPGRLSITCCWFWMQARDFMVKLLYCIVDDYLGGITTLASPELQVNDIIFRK